MKPVFLCLCVLVVSFVVMPENVLGQTASTNASRPTSEQSLEELVREVRQLRATLQRINTAMYKGQVMLERLRLQQDQVARMTRDLADTRENLTEIRGHQARLKEMLTKSETGVESGARPERELVGLKYELESLKDREQRLVTREVQLANDLEVERARLNELNDRLTALESELTPGRP